LFIVDEALHTSQQYVKLYVLNSMRYTAQI
jgi:hypothetical protein